MLRYIFAIALATILSCCSGGRYSAEIEYVLELAGDNRTELETVLNHYSTNKDDSMKLRAAEFLIINMPGKYTEEYDAPWEDVAAALYRWYDIKDKDSLLHSHGIGKPHIKEDVKHISAKYLIDNIDRSFDSWDKAPWKEQIDFETFCEEILPYRIGHEPLENWRQKATMTFSDLQKFFDTNPDITIAEACSMVNRLLPRFTWVTYPVPPMNYSMCMATPRGTCDEMCALAMFAMRALAIPVTRDFTPAWPNSTGGHAWNSVYIGDGKHTSFMGTEYAPGEEHLGTRLKKAKVYRDDFASTTDVSDEYNDCRYSASVPVDKSYGNSEIHLLSAGKRATTSVAITNAENDTARFRNIGKDILYAPAVLINGQYNIVGHPFMMEASGRINVLSGNNGYELLEIKDIGFEQSMLFRMQGGVFEGADNADFSDRKVLYTITDIPTAAFSRVRIPDCNKYRYVRYVAPNGANGNVAEIMFYDDAGHKLSGQCIGTAGSWYNSGSTCDKVFDGDVYTAFDAPQGYGDYAWAGLDLGHKSTIAEISCHPRIEDCRPVEGRTYEIFGLINGSHELIGRFKAHGQSIEASLPGNTPLYIRDTVRDMESYRYFIIRNGKQIWL